jgi:hypothetical protein
MGPVSIRKCSSFLLSLKKNINSVLTEQSNEKIKYLGEFDFKFETNLGQESGNQASAFDIKK